jgi:23S rRNA pseudouridine2605 synthase
VKVSGRVEAEAISKLRAGVYLPQEPGKAAKAVKTAPCEIRLLREAENPWYEITLVEGRNRQIRRMFEQVGHHVEKIKRVRFGPLVLNVDTGQYRELSRKEVGMLKSPSASLLSPRRPARPEKRFSVKRAERQHAVFQRGKAGSARTGASAPTRDQPTQANAGPSTRSPRRAPLGMTSGKRETFSRKKQRPGEAAPGAPLRKPTPSKAVRVAGKKLEKQRFAWTKFAGNKQRGNR